jgi:hypothetical protein
VFGSYLSIVISLLLTNTVSPVSACLSIWLEMFSGSQKEDERGTPSMDVPAVRTL